MNDSQERKPRFLIADDTIGVRETLTYMLEKRIPCEVVCAATADELIDRLERARQENQDFDVMILDLEMPLVTGEPPLKSLGILLMEHDEIQKRYFHNGPQIIVFTQYPTTDHAFHAGVLGAARFVAKHDEQTGYDGFLKVIDIAVEMAHGKLIKDTAGTSA